MIHALHVIHSLEPGGAEKVLVELAEAARRELRVSVVSLMAIRDDGITSALRAAGAAVSSLGLSTRWDPRAFSRCGEELRRQRPDVVHTHLKHADIVGGVMARSCGIPVVSTLHVVEDDLPRRLDQAKRRLALGVRSRLAARVVTVSEAQRCWYLEWSRTDPARVVTIRNGVKRPVAPPAEAVRDLRRALRVPEDARLAVSVGLLRPEKGHALLLEALQLVRDDLPLVVALAGDGPLRSRLETQAAVSGLDERVRFLGYVADVDTLLAAADVVVQPSLADALPTALLQALAAGRAVVASRVGGIPEIVGEAGLLVAPDDPAALATALTRVVEDSALRNRLGQAAAGRFPAFSAERWRDDLLRCYAEVLASSSPARGHRRGTETLTVRS